MKNALRAGMKYLKKEGTGKFIVRVIKWIPEYIVWKRLMIRGWLREHVERYRWQAWYLSLKKELKIDAYDVFKNIMGGVKYCKKNNQPYEVLNYGEKVEVVLPKCFEEREEVRKNVFNSPPIYLTVFTDVDIYSATNLITKREMAVSDLYERDRGENRYDIEGGCLIVCQKKGKWLRTVYKTTNIVIEEAINCVGWACRNYYHFTFEILSRLAFVDQNEQYRQLPVLVDAEAMAVPQMKQLFDRVNVYRHPVILVEQYNRIHVRKLVYISRNMWMPPNFKPGIVTREEDYLFSRSVVDNIRSRVLDGWDKTKDASHKKIYLSRRKCNNQRLANAVEIERIFGDYGYYVVFPEELSFEEEVAVFHGADVIVGATGAAFTNMVFCHEGAKVGIIIPSESDPYPFSNIANMVNVDFMILGADIVKREKHASLDMFALNADKCKRYIEYICESIGNEA